MSAQHTPGPWVAEERRPGEYTGFVVANGLLVAVTGRDSEGVSNAALIAAAPDLLAALKEVLAVMPVLPDAAKHLLALEERYDAAINAARAAIAKAEGRT